MIPCEEPLRSRGLKFFPHFPDDSGITEALGMRGCIHPVHIYLDFESKRDRLIDSREVVAGCR